MASLATPANSMLTGKQAPTAPGLVRSDSPLLCRVLQRQLDGIIAQGISSSAQRTRGSGSFCHELACSFWFGILSGRLEQTLSLPCVFFGGFTTSIGPHHMSDWRLRLSFLSALCQISERDEAEIAWSTLDENSSLDDWSLRLGEISVGRIPSD